MLSFDYTFSLLKFVSYGLHYERFNAFLTFCLFLIPHILPLARYNVATSRHKTHQACSPSFQFTETCIDTCIVPVFFSPFSPISPVQDYIYSKYRTQLTQLNNNTHLKNLASYQIRRCRVRNCKFVLFFVFVFVVGFFFFFFFRFTRENVLGYFVSLLHEKMQIFGTRFRESLATVPIFNFLNQSINIIGSLYKLLSLMPEKLLK